MERSETEASSSLATVQDIQRRFHRPSSLLSPPSTSRDAFGSCNSSQFNAILTDSKRELLEAKERSETTTYQRKLDDYLDPILLCKISSKLGCAKSDGLNTKTKKELGDFEWPVDRLKVFTESSIGPENRRSVLPDQRNDGAVDLKDDQDSNDDVWNEQESCTPFGRFERTALKRFGG